MTSEKEYEERFLSKVDKEISNSFYNGTRCWEWKGSLGNKDYGMYYHNGRSILSHRYSYYLTFGEFDTKLFVLHHCDNPKCVNPNYLFLGTNFDNIQDKVKKGRQSHSIGELCGNSKLTEKKVIKIYKMYDSGNHTQQEIAEIFRVGQTTISNIVTGKEWNHLYKKYGG
jgi:predicted XRE-type DNA-binding protein